MGARVIQSGGVGNVGTKHLSDVERDGQGRAKAFSIGGVSFEVVYGSDSISVTNDNGLELTATLDSSGRISGAS